MFRHRLRLLLLHLKKMFRHRLRLLLLHLKQMIYPPAHAGSWRALSKRGHSLNIGSNTYLTCPIIRTSNPVNCSSGRNITRKTRESPTGYSRVYMFVLQHICSCYSIRVVRYMYNYLHICLFCSIYAVLQNMCCSVYIHLLTTRFERSMAEHRHRQSGFAELDAS